MHLSHVLCRIQSITVARAQMLQVPIFETFDVLVLLSLYHPLVRISQAKSHLEYNHICMIDSSYLVVLVPLRSEEETTLAITFSRRSLVFFYAQFLALSFCPRLPIRTIIAITSNDPMPISHIYRCFSTIRGQFVPAYPVTLTLTGRIGVETKLTLYHCHREDLVGRCGTRSEQV